MTDPDRTFGEFGSGKQGGDKGLPSASNGIDQGGEVQFTWATPGKIADIPPRQWAYGEFLQFGTASCIGAMDGAGKGMIAVALVISMITGLPLLGEKVWRTGRVAIVTYEDDEREWRRRIAAACLHYQATEGFDIDYETVIQSVGFLHKPGGRVTFAERNSDGLMFPDHCRIVHFLKEHRIVLLLVDPFNSAHAMEDGNNNVAITAVAQEITGIAQITNVAALVLHHLRKSATGTVDDLMGAVALRANFRAVRIVVVMTKGEAIGIGLPAANHWRYLRIADSKENHAPPLDQAVWYRKVSVPLNNPADIYVDGDNVGAVARWSPPALFENMTHDVLRAVFDAIAAKPHTKSKRASVPWVGRPLMDAGKTADQAKHIIDLWLQNDVLVDGEPVKGNSRHLVQTVTLNRAKAAEVLAPLASDGAADNG